MAFTPDDPHISAALVLTGMFSQFADPLDWMAKGFGVNTKVERGQLMESLASTGGMGMPKALAKGKDKVTRFKVEIVGKCEGRMVAQCVMSINHLQMTRRTIEENALQLTVAAPLNVMGIQATRGRQSDSLDGLMLEKSATFLRLLPINIFNRLFFKEQLSVIEKDRKVKLIEVGEAVVVELVKPWLFYDMPIPHRKLENNDNLLPFLGQRTEVKKG